MKTEVNLLRHEGVALYAKEQGVNFTLDKGQDGRGWYHQFEFVFDGSESAFLFMLKLNTYLRKEGYRRLPMASSKNLLGKVKVTLKLYSLDDHEKKLLTPSC